MTLSVIKPLTITDAILTGTDVLENDYPAIAGSHAYAVGDRVISTATHQIYECALAYTSAASAVAPQTDVTHWVPVSPTNKWKPFDTSNSTQVSKAASLYYEFTPGVACSSGAVLNASATSVRWRVTDPVAGVVYDRTTSLIAPPVESNWYSYFFSPTTLKEQAVATDLPSYKNAVIRVDLTAETTVLAGAIVIGQVADIGLLVTQGAKVGIQDYSKTETNDFGDTVLVQRPYARRFDITVPIANTDMDTVYSLLASLRATPCVWIASQRYAPLTIFGFYKQFDILISYANYSEVSLSIQGLT